MSNPEDSTQVVSEDTGGSQETSQATEVSETQAGNSLAGAALAELVLKDEVAKKLLQPTFQSNKDRGVAEANRKASEALSEVERLKSYMTPEDQQVIDSLRRDMVLDDIYKERYSPQVSGTEQKAEAQAPASSDGLDFIGAFKDANYDLSKLTKEDLEFADTFKSQNALERALLERNLESPADPSSVVQGSGGNIPIQAEKLSMEVATAKMEELRLAYPASKRPKNVQEEMDALDKRLEEGLK